MLTAEEVDIYSLIAIDILKPAHHSNGHKSLDVTIYFPGCVKSFAEKKLSSYSLISNNSPKPFGYFLYDALSLNF